MNGAAESWTRQRRTPYQTRAVLIRTREQDVAIAPQQQERRDLDSRELLRVVVLRVVESRPGLEMAFPKTRGGRRSERQFP
jgi:hypothetical protein